MLIRNCVFETWISEWRSCRVSERCVEKRNVPLLPPRSPLRVCPWHCSTDWRTHTVFVFVSFFIIVDERLRIDLSIYTIDFTIYRIPWFHWQLTTYWFIHIYIIVSERESLYYSLPLRRSPRRLWAKSFCISRRAFFLSSPKYLHEVLVSVKNVYVPFVRRISSSSLSSFI